MNGSTTFGSAGTVAALAGILALFAAPGGVHAGHISLHTTPCDALDTVGGGTSGNSPGPIGPPNRLGWDVGSGQCNGNFAVVTDPAFASDSGGGIEVGMRIEQRSVGQVKRNGRNDYEVRLGNEPPAQRPIGRGGTSSTPSPMTEISTAWIRSRSRFARTWARTHRGFLSWTCSRSGALLMTAKISPTRPRLSATSIRPRRIPNSAGFYRR